MPLKPDQRELLEYLQTMLNELDVSSYSENLELIIETIDAALVEARETAEGPDGDQTDHSTTTEGPELPGFATGQGEGAIKRRSHSTIKPSTSPMTTVTRQ
jgi:hypothetical protein